MKNDSLKALLDKGLVWQGQSCASGLVRLFETKNIDVPTAVKQDFASAKFGIKKIDSCFISEGLPLDGVHEWYLNSSTDRKTKGLWQPPLYIVAHLIKSCCQADSYTTWIGRKCWPTPHLLQKTMLDLDWQRNCLFIDPPDKDSLLWSAIQAIRSEAVSAVVIEGKGLNAKTTRRLQLAAKDSKTFISLMRPSWEANTCPYAKSKWQVSPLGRDQVRTLSSGTRYPPRDILRNSRGGYLVPTCPRGIPDPFLVWGLELMKVKGAILKEGFKRTLKWKIYFDENQNTFSILSESKRMAEKEAKQNRSA